jgi:hypothetical protein
MSIELMTLAWRTGLATGPKMVLLVMCDKANDEGGSLWPSVKFVAKRSSMSERQVQRTLREFESIRLLRVVGNQAGGAPGQTRQYEINVRVLRELAKPTGDTVSPPTSATQTGDTGDIGRVTPATETGDASVTQDTIDPPVNPPEETAAKAAVAKAVLPPMKIDDLVAAGIERQLAADWLAIRRRAPLTVTTWEHLKREAAKANYTLSEAIQTAVDNSWRGFEARYVQRLESRDAGSKRFNPHDLTSMQYGRRPGEGDIPS